MTFDGRVDETPAQDAGPGVLARGATPISVATRSLYTDFFIVRTMPAGAGGMNTPGSPH